MTELLYPRRRTLLERLWCWLFHRKVRLPVYGPHCKKCYPPMPPWFMPLLGDMFDGDEGELYRDSVALGEFTP